ncbi:MAG TPA: alpha/beta fold hydrolase [Ilumatobacteraceae bacterium]|nr:alpha/beta fold hydrolase [Ilumatobacteraceae bacterium]
MIGVGESAHFVAEFNSLRAQIVADLITARGVTDLALEVGADEAPAINAWIRHDHDDALVDVVGPLTHCLYGTFLAELRSRLIDDHAVNILGVDLPNSLTIEPSLIPLAALIRSLDPEAVELVDEAQRISSHLTGGSAAASAVSWAALDRAVQDQLTVALARLEGRIRAIAPVHTGSDSEEAWQTAVDLAQSASTTDLMLRAMAELFSGQGRITDGTLREQFAASRILRAVDEAGPDRRFAYIAHNNHIQKTPVVFEGELTAYPAGLLLSNALGDRYVAVALTHLGGTVPEMAVPAPTPVGFEVETVEVEAPRIGSVEAAAATRASASNVLIVRSDVEHAAPTSIRSQSAVSDITTASFDATIVVQEASIDPAVKHLSRPNRAERRLDLGAIEIAAETFGDAHDDAVVLVMGATASMLWWPDRLCNEIARAGFRVVRYDHRDTGRSTTGAPGDVDYTVEDLTADLIGVMNALDIGAAHLVGMSLGGYISQIAALRYPDRVSSLTLLGSEPLGSTDDLPGIDDKFMAHFGTIGDLDWSDNDAVEAFLVEIGRLSAGTPERFDESGTRERVREEIARASNVASAFNHALVVTGDDWTDAVDRIAKPTLVIHGRRDPVVPLANGESLAARISGARLVILDGAGHELNPLDLDQIRDAFLSFTNDVADQAVTR